MENHSLFLSPRPYLRYFLKYLNVKISDVQLSVMHFLSILPRRRSEDSRRHAFLFRRGEERVTSAERVCVGYFFPHFGEIRTIISVALLKT